MKVTHKKSEGLPVRMIVIELEDGEYLSELTIDRLIDRQAAKSVYTSKMIDENDGTGKYK